jgi:Flp pilus assembly pilin Flp
MLLWRTSGRPSLPLSPAWLLRLYIKMQKLSSGLLDERGQDLVEYVIVAALISLAAIVAMKSVAIAIAAAYTNLATKLGTYIT